VMLYKLPVSVCVIHFSPLMIATSYLVDRASMRPGPVPGGAKCRDVNAAVPHGLHGTRHFWPAFIPKIADKLGTALVL
jgi:hypothetical protein